MLASLLAQQPNNQPIPHIPASVLTATPQDILPKVSLPENAKSMKTAVTRTITSSATIQRPTGKNSMQDNLSRMTNRQPNTNYLNSMLTNSIHHQQQNNRQMTQVDSYTSPNSDNSNLVDNRLWAGIENNINANSNDALLSDILDQVMDIVPEELVRVPFDTSLEQIATKFQEELSEKMAINIIQKSLMQCETAVKSPSSPTISLPAGTPPAYSAAVSFYNFFVVYQDN